MSSVNNNTGTKRQVYRQTGRQTAKQADLTWARRVSCLDDDVGNLKNLNRKIHLHASLLRKLRLHMLSDTFTCAVVTKLLGTVYKEQVSPLYSDFTQ